jgi:hypothetical protein
LKQRSLESFISRGIKFSGLPWKKNHLSPDVQEELLDFQINLNGTIHNMGQVYEQLYHDIINIIAPPNEEFEV